MRLAMCSQPLSIPVAMQDWDEASPSHSNFNFMPLSMPEFTAVPLTSDTCRVMRNVTQYLNYFFSTVTTSTTGLKIPPECLLSPSCNDVSCKCSNGTGYYNLSMLPCQSPPVLKLVTSGNLLFEHSTSRSEIVPFSPLPGISLNITFEKINHFFMGLAVSQYYDSNNNYVQFQIFSDINVL